MTVQPDNIKDDWRPRFLAALETVGNVTQACRLSSVARSTAYDARKADAAFAAAWDDALEGATDTLEAEARRRAIEGVEETREWGRVRKYSDALLIFLLKGANPAKYRDNYKPLPPPPPHDLDLNANVVAMNAEEREIYKLRLEQYIAKLRSMGFE